MLKVFVSHVDGSFIIIPAYYTRVIMLVPLLDDLIFNLAVDDSKMAALTRTHNESARPLQGGGVEFVASISSAIQCITCKKVNSLMCLVTVQDKI